MIWVALIVVAGLVIGIGVGLEDGFGVGLLSAFVGAVIGAFLSFILCGVFWWLLPTHMVEQGTKELQPVIEEDYLVSGLDDIENEHLYYYSLDGEHIEVKSHSSDEAVIKESSSGNYVVTTLKREFKYSFLQKYAPLFLTMEQKVFVIPEDSVNFDYNFK